VTEVQILVGFQIALVLALEVHLEGDGFSRWLPVAVVIGVERHEGLVDLGDERADPIHIAFRQDREHLVVAGNLRQSQAIDMQRSGIPVVRVTALFINLRREPAHFRHRTGTDRLLILESNRI